MKDPKKKNPDKKMSGKKKRGTTRKQELTVITVSWRPHWTSPPIASSFTAQNRIWFPVVI